jgi:hypothetical protein
LLPSAAPLTGGQPESADPLLGPEVLGECSGGEGLFRAPCADRWGWYAATAGQDLRYAAAAAGEDAANPPLAVVAGAVQKGGGSATDDEQTGIDGRAGEKAVEEMRC